MIDVSKLTPAPWRAGHEGRKWLVFTSDGGFILDVGDDTRLTGDDAEFIALARNAFDVMMRRGWSVWHQPGDGWLVGPFPGVESRGRLINGGFIGPDPFTAIVEADRWYRENVEKQP